MRKVKARKYYWAELRVGAAARMVETRRRRWWVMSIVDALLFELACEQDIVSKRYKVETVYK